MLHVHLVYQWKSEGFEDEASSSSQVEATVYPRGSLHISVVSSFAAFPLNYSQFLEDVQPAFIYIYWAAT
jgi:hypothetical protein